MCLFFFFYTIIPYHGDYRIDFVYIFILILYCAMYG
jgi:hypothetical protein